MQVLNKLGIALKKFFNSMQSFRFVLLVALYFGLERVSNIAVFVILLWSVYLFIKELIIKKGIRKIRYRNILYIFLGFALLTVGIHCERNLFDNLVMIYIMSVYFFQICGLYSEKSNIRCRKEMKFTLQFIVLITSLAMLIGFIGLAVFPHGIEWNGLNLILYESRFIGLFFNANVTGFYSAMAVIGCHILWRIIRAEKKLSVRRKVLYISCIAINTIALFLSDSNAALLFLVSYCSFAMFYIMFRDFGKKRMYGFILRILATILSFVVIITSLVFFRVVTQSQVSLAITSGQSRTELSSGVVKDDGIVGLKDDDYRENIFGHENKNIDSGRFKIWEQSMQMIEKFPLLGVGKANIKDYANEYIGGLRYDDLHNGMITILVSYGVVGANLFIVFGITIAKDMLRMIFRYKKKCRDDGSVPVLVTSFCIAYVIYSMFEVALLVDCSYRVLIFWLLVGFGMSYVQKYSLQAIIDGDKTDDQSVTDLPSIIEDMRERRKIKHMLKKELKMIKNAD